MTDMVEEKCEKLVYFADLDILCIDFLSVSSYHKNAMLFIQYGGVGPLEFLTEFTTDKEPRI